MLLLPNNLACLAKSADTNTSGARWAVTGIQLESVDNGKGYVAVATDTKRLVVVEGGIQHDETDYPKPDALAAAPNGGTKALIPAEFWESMFKNAAKNTKKSRMPILKNVGIAMTDGVMNEKGEYTTPPSVTMGWTNVDQHEVSTSRIVEGRFPPYRDIIPKRPTYTVAFEPQFLIDAVETLKTMMPASDKENECRVEIGFTSDTKPIVMRMQNSDLGQKITILVMPLASGENDIAYDGFRFGTGVNDESYWSKEAAHWNEQYKIERDKAIDYHDQWTTCQGELAKAKASSWKEHYDEANARIETLLRELEAMKEESQQLENRCRQLASELAARESDLEMYRQREASCIPV